MGEAGSKLLAGKRVMVTRAAEQSQPLIDVLQEAGAEAVVVSLVAFAPPKDFTELDRYFTGGTGKFDWVFLTSQNVVRALEERCGTLKRSLIASLQGAKVAAVGPSTADAARGAGLRVDYVSKVHNGVALANELADQVNGKRVFLPRSDQANPDLIWALARNGAQPTPVIAYQTMAADVDLQKVEEIVSKASVDAVLFFSPSAVHHLREMVGAERFREFGRQAAFVAIGPVSARALKKEGVERVLMAADTTVAAAIAVLGTVFSKAGQAQPGGAKPR